MQCGDAAEDGTPGDFETEQQELELEVELKFKIPREKAELSDQQC
jgi:hypothetical protein